MKDYLNKQFVSLFKKEDGIIFFSPGRVNLIGEHIDYNGGFVFPCALSDGTYGITSLRNDLLVRVFSEPFSKEIYEFNLQDIKKDENNRWADYIKASIQALLDHGYQINQGIDLYMKGTLPLSAGLSSSASLEMLVISIFNYFFKLDIDIKKMAKLGQYAENNYVGVNSGIMDQFAVISGKKNHAILLNTSTLSYQYVPFELKNDVLLIVNTNKKRGLADSKYNERYQECKKALAILKKHFTINYLCDLSIHDLPFVEQWIDPLLYQRVQHVVTEQNRTLKTKEALVKGDIQKFAELLNQSHLSLKKDYEVTGIELDTLQEELIHAGALGARMTGAGFGGCVVAIAPKELVDHIKNVVIKSYQKKIGYEPTFYEVNISDGTHIIK